MLCEAEWQSQSEISSQRVCLISYYVDCQYYESYGQYLVAVLSIPVCVLGV